MTLPFRKIIFWTHLILGLTAGLVILNMAVTGMILAFEPQIVDWVEHRQRVVELPADMTRLSPEEIAARASEAMGGGKVSAITIKSDPSASVLVGFGREQGAIYMNPYTGEALGGESKTHKFMHWVEQWHRWFSKKEIGKPITGAGALIFLFLAISGLYIWFPRNWNMKSIKSIMLFGSSLSGKARDFNWHNVFGFWCLPLIIITLITGLIMSYEWANKLLYKASRTEMPVFQKAPEPGSRRMEGGKSKGGPRATEGGMAEETPIAWNALFDAAKSQEAGWTSIMLRAPQKPGGPVNATVQIPHDWHPYPRTLLTLDARTAAITKSTPFSGQSRGVRWRTWVKPIHTGEAGGLIGQILMFLASLGAAMLVYTGAALSIRRYAGYRERNKSGKKSVSKREAALS